MPTWFVMFAIVSLIVVAVVNSAWIVMARGWFATDAQRSPSPQSKAAATVHLSQSVEGPRIGPFERRQYRGATLDLSRDLLEVSTVPFRGSRRWSIERMSVGSLRVTPVPFGALLRLYGPDGQLSAVIYVAHKAATLREKLASATWLTLLRD